MLPARVLRNVVANANIPTTTTVISGANAASAASAVTSPSSDFKDVDLSTLAQTTSICRIKLLGHTNCTPTLSKCQNGDYFAKFSLATRFTTSIKDNPAIEFESESSGPRTKQRHKEVKTAWHSILCFGDIAKQVSQRIKRGDQVFVIGDIQYRYIDGEKGFVSRTADIRCLGFAVTNKKSERVGAAFGKQE